MTMAVAAVFLLSGCLAPRGDSPAAKRAAAAKASEKGGALTGEVSLDAETTMYTLTQTGLMAKVNLAGTKDWRDDAPN